MSEPFVGEIRMFAGNFAPRGWAYCDGQLVAVSQNDALFSLFGTIYGGDGRTTFGLPDLRGRLPVHAGSGAGPGLTARPLGSKGGQETVTLVRANLPSHTHPWQGANANANSRDPVGKVPATAQGDAWTDDFNAANMATQAIADTGGGLHHDNMHPFLCIQFIVSLYGIYPSRH